MQTTSRRFDSMSTTAVQKKRGSTECSTRFVIRQRSFLSANQSPVRYIPVDIVKTLRLLSFTINQRSINRSMQTTSRFAGKVVFLTLKAWRYRFLRLPAVVTRRLKHRIATDMLGFKIATVAFLASLAVAQNLPPCANDCVGGENYNGCNKFDVGCICKSSDWIAGLACCVSRTCNAADQEDTIKFANKICAGAGVTTLPQTATCASTAASSETTANTASTPSSSALVTTTAEAITTSSTASAAAQSVALQTGAANSHVIGGAGFGAVAAGLALIL